MVLHLLVTSTGLANPLDAWGPAVGAGVLAANPNLNVGFDGTVEPQLILTQGFTDQVDVSVGAAMSVPGPEVGAFEVLPRYFPIEQVGLVVHAAYTPGDRGLRLGPEVHTTWSHGALGAYVDAGWQPLLAGVAGLGGAFVVAGAEVATVPHVWLFAETYAQAELDDEAAGLWVTPGVYATLDGAGNTELCVGVRLPAAGSLAVGSVGVWINQNLQVGRPGR